MILGLFLFALEHLLLGWVLRRRWGWTQPVLRGLIGVLILALVAHPVETRLLWVFLLLAAVRFLIDGFLAEEGDPRNRLYWVALGGNEMAHLWVAIFVLTALTGQYRFGLLLLAFEFKHWLADWCLTSAEMARMKGSKLLGPWLILHAGIHAGLTGVTMAAFGLPILWTVALTGGDYLAHSFVDRGKGWLGQKLPISKNLDSLIGRLAFGLDQALHHLTYAVIVTVVVALI